MLGIWPLELIDLEPSWRAMKMVLVLISLPSIKVPQSDIDLDEFKLIQIELPGVYRYRYRC